MKLYKCLHDSAEPEEGKPFYCTLNYGTLYTTKEGTTPNHLKGVLALLTVGRRLFRMRTGRVVCGKCLLQTYGIHPENEDELVTNQVEPAVTAERCEDCDWG